MFQSCDTQLHCMDVGCGTGELTHQVAALAQSVTAVDVSPRSIQIARELVGGTGNVLFLAGTLEEALPQPLAEPFSAAVAGMTLMTAPDLRALLDGIAPHHFRSVGASWARHAPPAFGQLIGGTTLPSGSATTVKWPPSSAIRRISLVRTDRLTTHIHSPTWQVPERGRASRVRP